MANLQEEIDKINNGLSKCSIKTRFNNFYVRGRFPDKNGSGKNKQYDISTGLKANLRYFKQATAIAYEIDSDILLNRWDWAKWIKINQRLDKTVEFWVAKFEENYWHRKEKTLSRADNFKTDYLDVFKVLPQTAILTTDLLMSKLTEIPPSSRQRLRYYNAFRSLLNFANINPPLPTNLKGDYKPNPDRHLISDDEIQAIGEMIKESYPDYLWIFGILATFGIRPHELFHLNYSRLGEDIPILEVLKPTKTRDRIVYPIPHDWCNYFDLTNISFPFQHRIEGKSNRQLGSMISKWFSERASIPISPYYLRDAYAVRGVRNGIESSVVARWMGHSLKVHHDHYGKYISEREFSEIWAKNVKIQS
jgi:integrase